MAKIERVYCWEMQKIANAYQIRVSFFNHENTYSKFHFYCLNCGVPLTGKNVMTHRNLNKSKNKTPHFATWKERRHSATCPISNPSEGVNESSAGNSSPVDPNNFYYDHLLLSPIDTGLILGVPDSPDELSEATLSGATTFEANYTMYQTSNFKDIVDCFQELQEKQKTDSYNLRIEDSLFKDSTYKQVFKSFKYFLIDYFNKGVGAVKYRVHYGNILNNTFTDEQDPDHWHFYINMGDDSVFWENEDKEFKPVLLKILLPVHLLDTNLQIKDYLIKQIDEGKTLSKCYVVNTEPGTPLVVPNKNNADKMHYESEVVIQDLNHIVLTFNE